MAKKDIRLQLVISPEELAALDAWRQKHAVWSRSEAIRRAIKQMVAENALATQSGIIPGLCAPDVAE